MAIDAIRCVRLIALNNALKDKQDIEYIWRRIERWYSKAFHTPLHLVCALPRLDVYQAYIEDRYEELTDEDLHKELQELLLPEDALERSLVKTKDDAAMNDLEKKVRQQNIENAQNNLVLKKQEKSNSIGKANIDKKLLENIDGLGKALEDIKAAFGPEDGFSLDFADLKE